MKVFLWAVLMIGPIFALAQNKPQIKCDCNCYEIPSNNATPAPVTHATSVYTLLIPWTGYSTADSTKIRPTEYSSTSSTPSQDVLNCAQQYSAQNQWDAADGSETSLRSNLRIAMGLAPTANTPCLNKLSSWATTIGYELYHKGPNDLTSGQIKIVLNAIKFRSK